MDYKIAQELDMFNISIDFVKSVENLTANEMIGFIRNHDDKFSYAAPYDDLNHANCDSFLIQAIMNSCKDGRTHQRVLVPNLNCSEQAIDEAYAFLCKDSKYLEAISRNGEAHFIIGTIANDRERLIKEFIASVRAQRIKLASDPAWLLRELYVKYPAFKVHNIEELIYKYSKYL